MHETRCPPLQIAHPPSYAEERRYTFEVLFREFLGLDYTTELRPGTTTTIRCEGERQLVLKEGLFATPEEQWLRPTSVPRNPPQRWRLGDDLASRIGDPALPILFGRPGSRGFVEYDESRTILHVDLLGSAFFLLSRYEEIACPNRDRHERASCASSFLGRAGLLLRPLVNEYLELLWHALEVTWPGLKRRRRGYRLRLSHDVDHLSATRNKPWTIIGRGVAGDLVRDRDPGLAWRRLRSSRGAAEDDPFNTFEFLMDCSERYDSSSAFYFMTGRSSADHDSDYDFDSREARALLRRIHERGHEVGLHPSYGTFRDADAIRDEFATLRAVAAEEQVHQQLWGGRQHYLRWEAPQTWQHWEDAGLDYDSSLAYAEQVGFRCGTCYEFPVFNAVTRKALALRERPLVAMEASLLDRQYMNLPLADAAARVVELARTCRRFDGDFTLLWHNSSLASAALKRTYAEILSEVAQ